MFRSFILCEFFQIVYFKNNYFPGSKVVRLRAVQRILLLLFYIQGFSNDSLSVNYISNSSPLFLSTVKALSYYSFHRTSSWFHWFFSIDSQFSNSLLPSLIFISFLLLPVDLICSSLFSFLKWKLGWLSEDLSSSLRHTFSAKNFPMNTAFTKSHKLRSIFFISYIIIF